MTAPGVAIVGAAETAEIGTVSASSLALATDAARRALADCGLTPADVDGVAISGLHPYLPTFVAHSLGIEARWVDATMVGGCSNLVHLRHAVAAIESGQCDVVLVTHGESGRSGIGGCDVPTTSRRVAGPVRVAVRHGGADDAPHPRHAALPP